MITLYFSVTCNNYTIQEAIDSGMTAGGLQEDLESYRMIWNYDLEFRFGITNWNYDLESGFGIGRIWN